MKKALIKRTEKFGLRLVITIESCGTVERIFSSRNEGYYQPVFVLKNV